MRVEVVGTFIIVLVFIVSYYYFFNKNNNDIQCKLKSNEMFFYQLEQQTKQVKNFKAAFAGGDDNNEVPVKAAIEKIEMHSNVRIKKYE